MKAFLRRLASVALKTVAALERLYDRFRYRYFGGPPERVQIMRYAGYRNRERLHLMGRVIKARSNVARGNGTLSRLRTMLEIYKSSEVPFTRVVVDLYGERHELQTDDEGYYLLDLDGLDRPLPHRSLWEFAEVDTPDLNLAPDQDRQHPILAPGADKRLGVISDIDDTIIETGATNFLKNWKRVLLDQPEDRLAVEGAPELYRMLASRGEAPENPIFYVSSGPWNLYGFLARFLQLQDMPLGPMILRDYGITETQFIVGRHTSHKTRAVERILAFYPDFKFLLIGDNGQKDIVVYAKAVRDFPHNVAGVFIRDVTGHGREGKNARHLSEIEAAGVPVFLGPTMENAIPVARRIGFTDAAHPEQEIA